MQEQTLSITLPTRWAELSDPQLCYLARLTAAGFEAEKVKSYLVIRSIPGEMAQRVRPDHLAVAMRYLDFLDTPPDQPVRPAKMGCGEAIKADLLGTTFADYLIIENLYQGVLMQAGEDFLSKAKDLDVNEQPVYRAMLEKLWPGYKPRRVMLWHVIALLWWMEGLKMLFSKTFPHLFRPTSGEADTPDMREVMETEIRALTGGDITKRQMVLESDTWVALAELDAKAREAEEITKGH